MTANSAAHIRPLYATPRDRTALTYGPQVARLAAAMGMRLMPWQRQVVNTALECDAHGVLRRSLVVVTIQRQSGKTTLLGPVMAHAMLSRPRARTWNTAQMRQDARDTWGELATLIQNSPLGALAKRRDANGQECLTFLNGSTLRPFNGADERALHGKQSDKVLADEAFAFSREAGRKIMQAVIPTMATRPGAQTWIVSTAGTAASTWLLDLVSEGRKRLDATGDSGRMAYFEWGIPPDTEDLTDIDVYLKHHPAVGHTIGRGALEAAREALTPSEFARAYGNYWTTSAEWVINPKLWDSSRVTQTLDMSREISLSAEVTANRESGVICVAGWTKPSEARPIPVRAMEVVDFRPGVGWIAPRLLELIERFEPVAVVVDPVSPAGTVHRALSEQRELFVPLKDFTAGDLVDAQTEFLDGLVSATVGHRTHERFDQAVKACTTRSLRETVVFSREVPDDGTSPAPLIAGMLAVYGVAHPPLFMEMGIRTSGGT